MSRWSVGDLAAKAGISIRTLHHYDAIGLLQPALRGDNGYRYYSAADAQRLHDILFYRALGFSLQEIGRVLATPEQDRRQLLLQQQQQLHVHMQRLAAMQAELEAALDRITDDQEKTAMNPTTDFGVFQNFDPDQYADEVQQRWGDTDAYAESRQRTSKYTKADWARFQAETDALNTRLVACMQEHKAASDPAVLEIVEGMRLLIDRWFYPCSRQMHANLGELYIADERFCATYEAIQPGMASFLRDAILANLARADGAGS